MLYLLLQIFFSALAPLSGSSLTNNWLGAVACAGVLSGFKTALLAGSTLSLTSLSFAYCTTALWECSTAALYFAPVRTNLKCTTLRRCVFQSVVPCSVQFEKRKGNLQQRGLHIAGCGAGAGFFYLVYAASGLEAALEEQRVFKTLFLLPILG